MRSPKLEFEPRQWYLVVICKRCHARQPMIHDLNQGKSEIKGIYQWRCPICQQTDYYHTEEIERYEHQPESPAH